MRLFGQATRGLSVADTRFGKPIKLLKEFSELWPHAVGAKYLRDLREMGVKNLTAKQILKLRRAS
jgi:hypothetical protein